MATTVKLTDHVHTGVRTRRDIQYREQTRDDDRDINRALIMRSATNFLGESNAERSGSGRTRSQNNYILSDVSKWLVQPQTRRYFRLGDVAKIYVISCTR
jgi:hypothetical protein